MRVSNYFVNSFYSVARRLELEVAPVTASAAGRVAPRAVKIPLVDGVGGSPGPVGGGGPVPLIAFPVPVEPVEASASVVFSGPPSGRGAVVIWSPLPGAGAVPLHPHGVLLDDVEETQADPGVPA
jgi:hypothetical protein